MEPKKCSAFKRKRSEIELHGSSHSYNSLKILQSEENKFEKITGDNMVGGRQHYLRWKSPDTWRILEKAGLKYDTTLNFAGHEGFGCGICFPYKPFDVLKSRGLDIWELPLTIMDRSLFGYQNLSPEEGFQRIKNIINTVKKYQGVLVLLWHNFSLDDLRLAGWIKVYEKTMEYIGRENVFNAPVKRIVDWWEENVFGDGDNYAEININKE